MREIKFRAWDKEYKVLRNVTRVNFTIGKISLCENTGYFHYTCNIDDVILMQYTGLKDKNGKEIYIGDIVEAWSEGFKHIGEVRKRVDGLYIIYPAYHNGFWGLKPNDAGETTVEVIGNIYENPELLEG